MSDREYSTRIRIDATPADVFPYLTQAELMIRWMGEWARLDPTTGGELTIDINGIPIRGRYLVVEPPDRLVFTWGAAGSEIHPPGSSTVEITLRDDGRGGTVLDLAHRDLPEAEQPQHGVGWTHFLERLETVAGGGEPGPDPWSTQPTS